MQTEEARLFGERTVNADRSQQLAAIVTIAGSGLVIALAGISIFLVRRSASARDDAEALLRDNNLNLETTVDERTADLREANDEIQRFAYIVSHDLRSPLVNIMGFTSELEELRGDIFRRIASLARAQSSAPAAPDNATDSAEPVLEGADKQLSQDFSEALGFIKSSIAKMDRLITAILNLTREGRREFQPVQIDTRELIETIVSTVAHQAAEAEATIHIEPLPDIVSDRLAMEQIFSNLIDNALKVSQAGSSRRDPCPGPDQARLCDFRGLRQRPRHRSQGPPADFRPVSPRRHPGQTGPGHRARPRPGPGAAARGNHVGIVGTQPRQYLHHHAPHSLGSH